MKRFFVFTLIALFATVSVFLTHLDAFDSDWQFDTKFDGTVYGETNVWVKFNDPIASSGHAFYVSNDGPGVVKYYTTATVQVFWNGGSVSPTPREDSGIIAANDSQNINENFSFNLKNKDEGNAHISATSALDVRHIPTNVKLSWPTAKAIHHFNL
jgi:hypothetical protein